MDFDISRLLEQWDYLPGQVVVRRFTSRDGREKIQLRVDLGVLQMNSEGRPDGKRPFGHASLLEYHRARLQRHVAEHNGSDEGFTLKPEECSKLQVEALQFHHRYICLLQLEDYDAAIRDGERNLAVFDFVKKHAESEDLAWSLLQFTPQLLMILTRARASQALQTEDHVAGIQHVEEGIEKIREFFRENMRQEYVEQSGEIRSLETWLQDLRAKRPLSKREQLEQALQEAIRCENYEKAAECRDALRNLETDPP